MSLATRCTSCGTVFRVVQDQLKISDGWVRCGQCSEVFNAVESLFDIDAAPTVPVPMPVSASTPLAGAPATSRAAGAVANPAALALSDDVLEAALGEPPSFSDTDVMLSDDELLEFEKLAAEASPQPAVAPAAPLPIAPPKAATPDAVPLEERVATPLVDETSSAGVPLAPVVAPLVQVEAARSAAPTVAPMVAPVVAAPARSGHATAARPDALDIDIDAPAPVAVARPSKPASRKGAGKPRGRADFTDARFDSDDAESDLDIDAEVAAALDNDPRRVRKRKPEFLRRAERAERWKSRPAKIGLALLSTVAGVALGAQVTHHFRAEVAARWPATKSALQGWCSVAGCNVEAPRAIDDIAVESTTLTQGATPDAFKLSVMLRSRGRVVLMTPSVNISLTDLSGKLISRKVLSPADFRVPAVIAPGAETALKATLSTPNARVTGYTVETFYP